MLSKHLSHGTTTEMKLTEVLTPDVVEVLEEAKKKKKAKKRKKTRNMFSGFRTPVAVGGAWGWGIGAYPPGDNSDEGDGGGGDE